ncbi:hypothetical protein SEUCBS139899_004006 [Sporothrix eucalyptigena]
MPSRNSFSIRKLFSTPRRLSLIADETVDERFHPKHRSHVSTSSQNSGSGASRGSSASRDSHESHNSQGSSSSTVFHPDSSISITTPQAERGLTDNVDHELSQEEIDRIKAVVAAAAAAAASSLRLRMDEGSEPSRTVQTIRTIEMTLGERHVDFDASTKTNEKEPSEKVLTAFAPESTKETETAAKARSATKSGRDNNEDTSEKDRKSQLRKKNRRIPQPIVVPPRPTPRSAGARPPRRSTDQRRDKGESGEVALPPPPPPRVSSYFGTRSSWKPKSNKSLLSISTTTTPITKSKPVASQPKAADAPAHPLYRGQKREPDGKKDSGIALDCSQTSLVGNASSDTVYESISDTTDDGNYNDNDDAASSSDAGSCIDLLQALAIQPEEADLLRRQTIDSTSTGIKRMDISAPISVDDNAIKVADGTGLRDVCTTPTFTQPRTAPTPSPSAVPSAAPSETNTPRRMLSQSPSPRPSFIGSSRTSMVASPPPVVASPPSPKKQTRFLPLRLNKGLPDAALRIQRKRSNKKTSGKRDRATPPTKGQPLDGKSHKDTGKGTNSNNNASNNGGGSSRWTLPDNVTELFNGRLFNRMEVNETLPFEKLQAIRESRALAQKQQEEAEEKKKAKQLQNELDEKEKRERQDRKQQQDLLDAEQALIKELQHPHPLSDKAETASVAPLETLVECEEEEIQVSPLDPDDVDPVDADGNPIPMEAPTPISPPSDNKYLPPPCLPMPPHIALQMVWPGEEGYEEVYSPDETTSSNNITSDKNTQTKTLFLGTDREEPDGSTTPIEPFHMQDLPSRIGAAGVRESVLLTNDAEQAYFISSVAQHRERRRREQEEKAEQEAKAQADDANIIPEPPKSPLDEIGPFPSPPTKNPMRFQSFIKKAALVPTNRAAPLPPLTQPPAQPIPQVTVTDVDSHSRRYFKGKGKAHTSGAKTPKSKFFFPPSSLVPPSSTSLTASSSTSSMAALAAASTMPHHRDSSTYVYLSATPFSLVMPTYRHGPIRLNRSDLEELRSNSRNSYEGDHRRPNIATVDETLDWTAFQMAILGGAGDFFHDSIDYGHISAVESDEAKQLADWFWSLDIRPGQLFKSATEDKEWIHPKAAAQAQAQAAPPAPTTAAPAPPPTTTSPAQNVYMHHTQRTAGPQQTSVGSSIHTAASSGAARIIGPPPRGFSHSRTTTDTSIGTVASGYSSNRDSSVSSNAASSNASGRGLTAQAANLVLPFPMSRFNSNNNSSYAMSCSNSTAANNSSFRNLSLESNTPPMAAEPRTMETIRASFASAASYESMPQSPMADLIMTRGADGKEYVAPMGYNLSHDIGDYLLWEQENVYTMTLEE